MNKSRVKQTLAEDWATIQPQINALKLREERMIHLRGDAREVEECRVRLEADSLEETIRVLGGMLRRFAAPVGAVEVRMPERRG